MEIDGGAKRVLEEEEEWPQEVPLASCGQMFPSLVSLGLAVRET